MNALLIETYKDYLETLDSNQVDIYDTNNSWSPNFQIQNSLLELITFTSKSLFDLGFDAKQERTYELPSDSNLIVLTHRFMGLDANDENIETFRQINKIKNSEIYRVPKGRLIKYFV
ncbi:hypothetical protein CHPG_00002 [Cellulophaga phage phi3:1]|nr:hypothetical protein CHPG_00002 [Cellulophaga phage phi3:1]